MAFREIGPSPMRQHVARRMQVRGMSFITLLADAATFVGAILLGWLLMQEKTLREFTICAGAVLLCGLGASLVLSQAMFAALIAAAIGWLILGSILAPRHWKTAYVLALRVALAALILGTLTPLTKTDPSLANALGIWTTLGLFWGWRKLKPAAASWKSDTSETRRA